jgi:hypothetical protein
MPQQVTIGSNLSITKHQVDLGNVTNDLQLRADQLDVDVCPLVSGKVPASKLPPVGAVQSVNGKTGDVVVAFDELEGNPFADDDVELKANSYRIKAEHTVVDDDHGYTVEITPALPFAHNGIQMNHAGLNFNQYDWKLEYGRLKWQIWAQFADMTDKRQRFRSCLVQDGVEKNIENVVTNSGSKNQWMGYDWQVDTRIPIEYIKINYDFTLPGQDDFEGVEIKIIGPFVSYPSKLIVDGSLYLQDIEVYRDIYQKQYSFMALSAIQKGKAVVLDESGIQNYQAAVDYTTPAIVTEDVFGTTIDKDNYAVVMLNGDLYVFYQVDGSSNETYLKRFAHDGSIWIEQQSIPVLGCEPQMTHIGNYLYCVYSKETGNPMPDSMHSVIFKVEIAGDGTMSIVGSETTIDPALTIQRGIWRINDNRLIANHQNLAGLFDGTGTKEHMVLVDADTLAVLDSYELPRSTIENNAMFFCHVDDTHYLFSYSDQGMHVMSFDIAGDTISLVQTIKPSPENGYRGGMFIVDARTYAFLSRDNENNQFIRPFYLDENYHMSYGDFTKYDQKEVLARSTQKNLLVYYSLGTFYLAVFKIDVAADQYEVLREEAIVAGVYHQPWTLMDGDTLFAFFRTDSALKMMKLEPAMAGGTEKPVGFALAETASGGICPVACGDIVPGFSGLNVGAKYGLDAHGSITLDAGGEYIALDTETIKYMGGSSS